MPPSPEKQIGFAQQMRLEEREEKIKSAEKAQEAKVYSMEEERAKKEKVLADQKREKPFDINSASQEELKRVEESLNFMGESMPGGGRILNVVEGLKADMEKNGEGKAVGAEKMAETGNKMRMALASLVEKMVSENLVCVDERGLLKPFVIGDMKISIAQNTNEDRVLSKSDVYNVQNTLGKIMELLAKNKITISFEKPADSDIENFSIDGSSNVEFETMGDRKNETKLLSTLDGKRAANVFTRLSEQMSAAKNKAKDMIDSKKLKTAA